MKTLEWLAAEERLDAFCAATGMDLDGLRSRTAQPATLGAVLDHVLSDESLARQATRDLDLADDALLRARAALPGGDAPHWT